MEEEQPIAKRKKCMTGKEVIERLESNENDVKRAVGGNCRRAVSI